MIPPGGCYHYGMSAVRLFLLRYRWIILGCVVTLVVLGILEYHNGSLPLGPDGRFGWWDGNINGAENSQRVADVYSLTHVVHGVLFYLGLWLVARKVPARYRFLAAVVLESGWELLENSPFIINKYRADTVTQGYVGDSILNSLCDVGMMAIGFQIARILKPWKTVLFVVALELLCLFWVRDNLTTNIIQLTHPIPAIREWQAAGQ